MGTDKRGLHGEDLLQIPEDATAGGNKGRSALGLCSADPRGPRLSEPPIGTGATATFSRDTVQSVHSPLLGIFMESVGVLEHLGNTWVTH